MKNQLQDMELQDIFSLAGRIRHHKIHEELDRLGLYRGQPRLLECLWEKDGMKNKELSKKMMLQPATVTKMVNRLEKAGFVVKKPDEKDLRVSNVFLTDKGTLVQKELKQLKHDINDICFQTFSSEERLLFKRLLIQIIENLTESDLYEQKNKE